MTILEHNKRNEHLCLNSMFSNRRQTSKTCPSLFNLFVTELLIKLQNIPGLPGLLFKNLYITQTSMHIGANNMANYVFGSVKR